MMLWILLRMTVLSLKVRTFTFPCMIQHSILHQPVITLMYQNFDQRLLLNPYSVELDLQRCSQLRIEDLEKIFMIPNLRRLNLYSLKLSNDFLSKLGRYVSANEFICVYLAYDSFLFLIYLLFLLVLGFLLQ